MTSEFVAIDFETADHGPDSACAIGLVRVSAGKITQKDHFLIRPPRRRIIFTSIHGIRWEDVAEEPDFGSLWPKVAGYFKGIDFLAAHNASFDRRVLLACCASYGIRPPMVDFQCTVQLARKTWNLRPANLAEVCRFLDIPLNHHHALSDAEACARIVLAANS